MQITQKYTYNNPCYTSGRTISVRGAALHSVGCAQPSALVFQKNFNTSGAAAAVHAFIDANSGEVIQCLPWNRRAWHAGKGSKGSANDTHIGIEMCEPSGIKYTGGASFQVLDKYAAQKQAQTAYKSAVELFAFLCKQYALDPLKDGVIISHSEGYKRGIASCHADPEHLWKGLGLAYTMDGFRRDVYNAMHGTTTTSTTVKPAEPAKVVASTTGAYIVRITASALNVRKGPGTTYAVTTTVKKGEAYTITETQNGWGKLKSGAGWISLSYTQKV